SVGPHGFYWFGLQKQHADVPATAPVTTQGAGSLVVERHGLPLFQVGTDWREIFGRPHRVDLERSLLSYVRERRWFGGKGKTVRNATVERHFRVDAPSGEWELVHFAIEYAR